MRFAHTSPVYVRVGNDLGIVPEDAAFFVDSMDRAIAFLQSVPGFHSPADRDAMVSMFRQARAVYARLAAR